MSPTHAPGSNPPNVVTTPSKWVRVVLGLILILAGIIVLGDMALAATVSTIFLGLIAAAVGAFEVVHALGTQKWGGFVWRAVLGVLYLAFGVALLSQPALSATLLAAFVGLLLLLSGGVRVVLGFRYGKESAWPILVSGVIGVLIGFGILSGLTTGLWAIGFLFGVDLLVHGAAWLAYAGLSTTNR